ncbi:MAG: DUF2339 domain-containing protein, partial [Alphaproteobacteria bacterium]|nr:DUF2339 domain-containing protein [Alphaproteobacteria bacterium]
KKAAEKPEHLPSFEWKLGARLPVWIGGIALAFAGFYLVKYSIDLGILTPAIRVVLGFLFGLGLLGAAQWVHAKKDMTDGSRISQALAGAGVAVLYGCFYAATSLYNLVPDALGFLGMAAVTGGAVVLSVRHGMPVALMAMAGGFATPALFSTDKPSALVLFGYLYLLVTGLLYVVRKMGWWRLSGAVITAAFAWVCLWGFGSVFGPGDAVIASAFVVAVALTVLWFTGVMRPVEKVESDSVPAQSKTLVPFVTMGVALVLTLFLTHQANFGFIEWALFWLLSVAGMATAHFNQRVFGYMPLIGTAVTGLMLFTCPAEPVTFGIAALAFGVLHAGGGFLLQRKSALPVLWAVPVVASSLGYFVIAYMRLSGLAYMPWMWGGGAMVLAVLATSAALDVYRRMPETHVDYQKALSLYAGAATAFISTAFAIVLSREFLPLALCGELAALAWIYRRNALPAILRVMTVLLVAAGVLMFERFLLGAEVLFSLLFEAEIPSMRTVARTAPFAHLALPAAVLFAAIYLMAGRERTKTLQAMEVMASLLGGFAAYFMMQDILYPDNKPVLENAEFMIRGIKTSVVFLVSVGVLWAGRVRGKKVLYRAGIALAGVAIYRMVAFDMVVFNPLWSREVVTGWPVINAMLVNYALPLLPLYWLKTVAEQDGFAKSVRLCRATMFAALFLLLTLNIRHVFHGELLHKGVTPHLEIYIYSAAWIVYGFGLLFFGALRHNKPARVAALAIITLTVGKVFLYDAGELEGLYRVFSFFGLGVSLLGLSWFYNRFVVPKEQAA